MAKLVVISEEMKGRVFELTEDKISVGRLPDNQVRLEDGAISSHHAELTRKGDDYVVRDLNSTNGTRVNNQRIVETRLYHGDTLSFGHLQLQYFSSATGTPQPLPSPLKKTVDLSSAAPSNRLVPPPSYGSTSPFAKQKRSKSTAFFQIAVIALGLIAIILLAFFITKVLNV